MVNFILWNNVINEVEKDLEIIEILSYLHHGNSRGVVYGNLIWLKSIKNEGSPFSP